MKTLTALLLEVLVSLVTAHCPETEVGLKKWSDSKNTWNGSVNITFIIFIFSPIEIFIETFTFVS